MTPNTVFAALRSGRAAALTAAALLLGWTAFAIAGSNSPAPAASAGTMTADQRKELQGLIKDYLTKNPEILLEMQNALDAKMEKAQEQRTAAVVKGNAAEIFHPAFSGVVGNTKGDVTVVEFFDYNCPYCRRAVGDVTKLIDKESKVRLVLKELPILSKGSEEAARVALAAKMQGKYWEFHRAALQSNGQVNEAAALRIAEKLGLDMTKLKKDMASPEIKKEIDETRALAQKLGIQGTPFFMVGDRIIPGAPDDLLDRMSKMVTEVRKEGCKVC
jgi:protein-disulfide isomerase